MIIRITNIKWHVDLNDISDDFGYHKDDRFISQSLMSNDLPTEYEIDLNNYDISYDELEFLECNNDELQDFICECLEDDFNCDVLYYEYEVIDNEECTQDNE